MKNKILYVLLFLPAVVFAALMSYYTLMCNFKKVEIAVQGYDPKDFLQGYYMQLRLDWDNTDCKQFASAVCPKEDFNDVYRFYINLKQSNELTSQTNSGAVKLVFSYQYGRTPQIVDLLINNQSYLKYFELKNSY